MNRKLCITIEERQEFAVKLEHRRFCELRSEPDLEAVFRRDASFKATDQYLVRNG